MITNKQRLRLCFLQDIGLSKDLNDEFKTHLANRNEAASSIDFQIQVLSSGSWPFSQCGEFALPTEVCQLYKIYYSVCQVMQNLRFIFAFTVGTERKKFQRILQR